MLGSQFIIGAIQYAETDSLYYVWYSRNVDNHKYVTTYYATSPNDIDWTLKGEVLPPGPSGAWDNSDNIAPYIVVTDGKYYLFYTSFCKGDLSTRHLGCAMAEMPAGSW
ncbi:TPA: hypothetical protein EYN98_08665 [Candidatus Poribacteria bacterium]|nr:hypothetical protein [Candidatus Poribacteria bacterium]HIA66123.1 hypothetical protein [Candidatus Poribacteria bacterium]HIB87864.1 hypothetical protein [Candidatus Poribacteria bacterium]HIC01439.1 hypothetical protein [Candidatus Poribacteria bacterium]HIC18621.1 hypothetical protein [Candidatus Poribacteria bacterium]